MEDFDSTPSDPKGSPASALVLPVSGLLGPVAPASALGVAAPPSELAAPASALGMAAPPQAWLCRPQAWTPRPGGGQPAQASQQGQPPANQCDEHP